MKLLVRILKKVAIWEGPCLDSNKSSGRGVLAVQLQVRFPTHHTIVDFILNILFALVSVEGSVGCSHKRDIFSSVPVSV